MNQASGLFDVFLQDTIAVGVAQLAQSLGFNLTDALTGDIKDLTDFFEGLHPAVVEAVTQTQHVTLTGAQGGENTFKVITQQVLGHVLIRVLDVGFDEVAEA